MPTSLVTGGAGFLGSHLCEALLARGHRVICLDNLETGSLANIEHLRDEAFAFVHARPDATRRDRRADRLRLPPRQPCEPDRLPAAAAADAEGRLARDAQRARPRQGQRSRFLLASTSEVYGDPQVHPQPETYWGHVNPIGPRGVYDEAKRYAEALTMAYHRQQGVDTAIVRIFNTYGPRMRPHDGRAIPTFIRQALEEKPLTVFGDGSQTRSFCYVDDLVRGLILLAESGEHMPVNIGNPTEMSLLELAEAVARGDRLVEPDRVRGAAGRRPAGAAAGHHARDAAPRLGAGGRARRRPPPHAGVAREGSGACVDALAARRRCRRRARCLLAPTASASPSLRLGIFDDGMVLYGEPDLVFPQLANTATQLVRVNLWWSGPGIGVATRKPRDPTDPNDPAYNWDTYDRTVRFAIVNGMQPSSRSSARRRGRTRRRAGTSRRRTRATCGASRPRPQRRYSGTFVNADGVTLPRVSLWMAWNEPNNPVFLKPQYRRTGKTWTIQSGRDYAKICNAIVQGIKSDPADARRSPAASPRRAGTTTRTRAARPSRRSRSCAR